GKTPIVSRYALRRKSSSLTGGDGGRFKSRNFTLIKSSMKLRCGNAWVSGGLAYGTEIVAVLMRLKYQAVIGPSPRPATVALPSSSTVQTDVSLAVYFAQWETSRSDPSLKCAIT